MRTFRDPCGGFNALINQAKRGRGKKEKAVLFVERAGLAFLLVHFFWEGGGLDVFSLFS